MASEPGSGSVPPAASVIVSAVGKRKLPTDVKHAVVYPGWGGFRYTCRDSNNKVVYDSPMPFRSRRDAREQIRTYWPEARVDFDVK